MPIPPNAHDHKLLWRALPLHYRDTSVDRADDLARCIERLRNMERIAEWRRLCGRLPEHLEQLARCST